MWQALSTELADENLVVITVAIDRTIEDAREWIGAAAPTHPSLIDTTWLLADLYNIDQVPTSVWIDESGRIVRPNDATFGNNLWQEFTGIDADVHRGLLTRWVRHGIHLEPEKVHSYQRLPTDTDQLARAEFGLARHLWQVGRAESAEAHFTRAGELAPHQFTIRRGSMPMRAKDPMGQEFFDMMSDWAAQGKPLNIVVPE